SFSHQLRDRFESPFAQQSFHINGIAVESVGEVAQRGEIDLVADYPHGAIPHDELTNAWMPASKAAHVAGLSRSANDRISDSCLFEGLAVVAVIGRALEVELLHGNVFFAQEERIAQAVGDHRQAHGFTLVPERSVA